MLVPRVVGRLGERRVAATVGGSFAAAGFTTGASWRALGWATALVAVAVGTLLLVSRTRVEAAAVVDG